MEYSAKMPAVPRFVKFTASYLFAAVSTASASCGSGNDEQTVHPADLITMTIMRVLHCQYTNKQAAKPPNI